MDLAVAAADDLREGGFTVEIGWEEIDLDSDAAFLEAWVDIELEPWPIMDRQVIEIYDRINKLIDPYGICTDCGFVSNNHVPFDYDENGNFRPESDVRLPGQPDWRAETEWQ
jgi:hypothetical protein